MPLHKIQEEKRGNTQCLGNGTKCPSNEKKSRFRRCQVWPDLPRGFWQFKTEGSLIEQVRCSGGNHVGGTSSDHMRTGRTETPLQYVLKIDSTL